MASLLNGCLLLFNLDGLTESVAADSGLAESSTAIDAAPEVGRASNDPALDSAPYDASEGATEALGADSGTPDSMPKGSKASEGGLEDSANADVLSESGGQQCGSNLLTTTIAVASTIVSPNVAAKAVDGVLSTRWESAQLDPQWIDVDFGAPVFIDEVDILWEAACAKDYELQISSDATTWTTIPNGTVTGNTLAANSPGDPPTAPTDWTRAVVTKPLAAVGRYLRVNGTMRCTIYGYSIWEMRAYGDENANCKP